MTRTVRILGTHGVPAAYGGFETAAENVARHLVDHGWRVVVYCQEPGTGPVAYDDVGGHRAGDHLPIPATAGWAPRGSTSVTSATPAGTATCA